MLYCTGTTQLTLWSIDSPLIARFYSHDIQAPWRHEDSHDDDVCMRAWINNELSDERYGVPLRHPVTTLATSRPPAFCLPCVIRTHLMFSAFLSFSCSPLTYSPPPTRSAYKVLALCSNIHSTAIFFNPYFILKLNSMRDALIWHRKTYGLFSLAPRG